MFLFKYLVSEEFFLMPKPHLVEIINFFLMNKMQNVPHACVQHPDTVQRFQKFTDFVKQTGVWEFNVQTLSA